MRAHWAGSRARFGAVIAALSVALLGTPTGKAQQQPLHGNPQRGKILSYTCLGCHGVDGYKNAYPNYSVPELEGQHPEYLQEALKEYRDGNRDHITMHSQASELSDQDIADVVSYFAGVPLTGNGQVHGTVPAAAQVCTSCHGQTGISISPLYPSLSGQHPDYIVRALEEYKKGDRKNPIMVAMASQLKDADIPAIAAYFASQRPALATESRPYTALGEHSSQ